MTDDQTTSTAEQPPAARPPLTRSDEHRVVAGVCGGLGRHLDIDPVVFRVVTAVLCLSGGLGLFLYGLGWLIVPREPAEGREGRTELQRVLTGRVDGQSVGAVLLTVIGTGVFFSSMDDGGQLFPLLLLCGLVFLAVRYDPERHRRRRRGPMGEAWHQHVDWPAWKEQLARDFKPEWEGWKAHMQEQMRAQRQAEAERPADTPPTGPSGYLWDPRHPERNPYSGHTPPPGAPAEPWWKRTDLPEGDPLRKGPGPDRPAPPAVAKPRRQHSFLGPLGLLLGAGGGALAWAATEPHGDAKLSTVLAAALLGLAVPLLIGAKFGRAKGLTLPALVLTVALAGTFGVRDTTVGEAFGDRSWAPVTAAELRSEYSLGAGDLRLDLSGLAPAGATLSTTVRLGAGDAYVTVPKDVTTHVKVRNAIGDVRLPNDSSSSGVANNRDYTLGPAGGLPAKGNLDLTVYVGIGDIHLEQAL
ncbi:PspC domain-containing protein [Kitasatospora sp. NPDC002227]|uniref:PspC domain-containing protein n=1 Tax=Kitasatospora sp. NPDC002227 TaxID=3154773 RepID=UPI003328BAD1